MNKSERIHKAALEIHSWIENQDFKMNPEPSVQEIEDEIRDHLELDAKVICKHNWQPNPYDGSEAYCPACGLELDKMGKIK